MWRDARRGDPAAAHALRVRRPRAPAAFPGLAVREARAAATVAPLVATVAEPLPPDASRTSCARRVGARRSGWDRASRAANRAHHAGRRRVRASTAPTFRARARRDRPSRPRAAPRAHRRGARVRAARLRVEGRGRRRRHGRRHRVAERAGRRERGRLDPPPRAAAPAAERPAPSSRSAASRRSTPRDERRAATLRELSTPSTHPGAAWDEPSPLRRSRRAFRRVETAVCRPTQVICATGFRKGSATTRCCETWSTRTTSPTHGRWIVLDADSTVPR